MGDPIIRVENLGKRYRIGRAARRPDNLREALKGAAGAPFRYLLSRLREPEPEETLWALRNVSFEVQRGEVLGIIGRNGAGKSTLLKILSRITEPTEGSADLYGRVGSLLEVGTGFHPELTGRENIYLNGTVLGMKKGEIDRKFDEIVAFSGVEKFLDTPVKRYSSGMYVRLAFAVAAHLDPEILIVDEVLAVGDAAFQKKCLGKMGEVAGEGRTVLFVSHNMASIESLTERTIQLKDGVICRDSDTHEVIEQYLSTIVAPDSSRGDFIRDVLIRSDDRSHSNIVRTGDPVIIDVIIDPDGICIPDADLGIGVNDALGTRLFTVGTYYSSLDSLRIDQKSRVRCRIAAQFLRPGTYPLKVALSSKSTGSIESLEGVYHLDIHPADVYGNGSIPGKDQGFLMIRSEWHHSILAGGSQAV